jgi:hypothetical protein
METRKTRAEALRDLCSRGPAMNMTFMKLDLGFTLPPDDKQRLEEYLEKRYRMWAECWVLPSLEDLIPELRK